MAIWFQIIVTRFFVTYQYGGEKKALASKWKEHKNWAPLLLIELQKNGLGGQVFL